MIFSVEEVRRVRQGKQTATLLPVTAKVNVDTAVRLRRRLESGEVEDVADPTTTSDKVLVFVTIRHVFELELAELTIDHAKLCGLRTASGLRESFRHAHPRATRAKLVRFDLGDMLERARWLRAGGPGPTICPKCKRGLADGQAVCRCGRKRPYARPEDHGYTSRVSSAMLDAGEALSEEDTDRYALLNGQKFIAHNLKMEAEVARRGIVQRLRDVEAAAPAGLDVRKELRIIEQRIERAERRAIEDPGAP